MKRLHRAWAVCLGCTMMMLVCSGLGVNAFSVSQPYILAQNGFTNTQTSMIVTVRSVMYLLSMFALRFYYKKLGYRLGMALSVLLSAASFALFAVAKPLNTVGLTIWATDFSPVELVSRRVQHFQLCYALGSFIFSFMPGVFADLTGSYAPSYVVFFAFGAFALVTVQLTYRQGSRTQAGV